MTTLFYKNTENEKFPIPIQWNGFPNRLLSYDNTKTCQRQTKYSFSFVGFVIMMQNHIPNITPWCCAPTVLL